MKRRHFLIGTGTTAIGGSALLGSGAFSRVESQRGVTVQVAQDPDAYLGMDKCRIDGTETPNSSYAWLDDKGHLEILMNPENPTVGESPLGDGINSDSRTWFDNVFQLCNQGKQLVCVWIQDDDDWPFYDDDERQVEFYLGTDRDRSIIGEENAVVLPLGECVCVGIRTTSLSLSEGEQLLAELDNKITIIADDDCPGDIPPEEGSAAICGEKRLTDELESFIEGLEPNGEFDPENPRAGWEIQLTPDPAVGPAPLSVTTDENGQYCFEGLFPGEYTVCEVPKPGTVPIDPEDGCYVVTVGEDEIVEAIDFENDIENDSDEPHPRTIGFWSNWSGDCTPGGQENLLGETLDAADGIQLGALTVTATDHAEPPNCGAVDLLLSRDLDGTIRASDGAYNLASQLLAAKLNRAAGAAVPGDGTGEGGEDCADVQAQIDAGQALLDELEFDGTGSYLLPGATDRQTALDIADCLDQYNNGEFTS